MNNIPRTPCFLSWLLQAAVAIGAISTQADDPVFKQPVSLGVPHSTETQYFTMETANTIYALDGTRTGLITYHLKLKCVPAAQSGKEGNEYTCVRYSIIHNEKEVTIPDLAGWSYIYKKYKGGADEKGQIMGIDHGRFENLKDNQGNVIPQDQTYAVYNSFVDFHSIVSVFGEKTLEGRGIQDLKQIGQAIIHSSAYSEPPINLGNHVEKGSTFKNGEITLTLKGISQVNERTCALVGYDSGASSFKMIMKPMPDMEIRTVGSSHYKGDIYIDLDSNWVQKSTLDELVITETTLPTPPNKINNVIERNITMDNVSSEVFSYIWEKEQK